jgi:glycerate dehydrogenase
VTKIAVLDGYTLNPGDLNWDSLRALGDCTIHDRTAPGETLARAAGHEIVLTNKVRLTQTELSQLPGLRYIGVLATGTDVIDLHAAHARNVVVCNVPDYSTASVAQLTFALLLELALQVGAHSQGVRSGKWCRSPDFSYTDRPLLELEGLTLGIVGFGRIGRRVAALGQAFGMSVLVHTRTLPDANPAGGRFVDLQSLLRDADVVTLHCPLTDATRGMINAERLKWMKPSARLINTSRGPLIDEAALADALNAGRLAGAAVDVLSLEPARGDNPLLTAGNCLITPHLGWATVAARQRLMDAVVENVRAFLNGNPRNVVPPR